MKHKNLIITGAIFAVLLIYVLMTQTGDKGFNTLTLPKIPTITYENLEKNGNVSLQLSNFVLHT